MADRSYYPPNGIGGDDYRDAGLYGQSDNQNGPPLNGFSPHITSPSGAANYSQNGHYQHGNIHPSMRQYNEKPTMYQPQSGNSPTQASYTNITAPKSFDPYGYRTQQQRSAPYQQQQRTSNFIPNSRQQAFVEEQHSRPSSGFGSVFTPHSQQNNGASGALGRPSLSQPQFLPGTLPPSFHTSPGGHRPFQQQFQSGQQANSDFAGLPPAGNFDMMMFDGMNGQIGSGRQGHPMMNGFGNGEEFLGNEFVPPGEIGGSMPAQYVLSNELLGRIENSPKKMALFELQIGLEQIAYESMNFNTWATVIKDRMTDRKNGLNEADLRIAAEILIEMSVVLDESQYNFSRLCQFLGMHIDNFNQNVLLPQVSAFVNETNTFLSPQHLRNLVTFLAELYDKIEIKGVKSSQLAAHLFDQLQNLVKVIPLDDQSIGVIVKSMKLVGRFLENDRGPQAMDEFFAELDAISGNASGSAKDKLQNLQILRSKQWGVVAGTPLMGAAFPVVGILGPDGEQLTEDECNFLDETFEFGNSPSGSMYNPMDDDNVEDDYEKFLQATAIQAAEKALEKVSIDEDDESSVLSSPKFPILEKH